MNDKLERSIGKTSVFSAEILRVAPADLEITRNSNKYRDLRNMLLNAMTEKAWGIRFQISSQTAVELRHQIRNLSMAGKSWERAVKLNELHNLKLIVHYVVDKPEEKTATLDLFFDKIEMKGEK